MATCEACGKEKSNALQTLCNSCAAVAERYIDAKGKPRMPVIQDNLREQVALLPVIAFVLQSVGIANAEDLRLAFENIKAVEAQVSTWMKDGKG